MLNNESNSSSSTNFLKDNLLKPATQTKANRPIAIAQRLRVQKPKKN